MRPRLDNLLSLAPGAFLIAAVLTPTLAHGQMTEIIEVSGDGMGADYRDSEGIAVDSAGNVYTTANSGAFKVTPGGTITQIIDLNGGGSGSFLQSPGEIAVDDSGNVFVVGIQSDNAFKITPAGVITEIIDVFADGAGNFLMEPRGIAVDGAGNVYVSGSTTRNVFKVTPGGVITEIIDFTGDGAGNDLERPYGVAVDNAGNAYVTGKFSSKVFKITPGGMISEIIDSSGDGFPGTLSSPEGLAVSSVGNVYVAGNNSRNVFCVSPIGDITKILFNTGGPGSATGWSNPTAIAVDSAGDVYVNGDDNAFHIDLIQSYVELCHGDGGDQAGCTDCPCMNNAPVGTFGGCLNSVGDSSRLIASGDPSVSLPPSSFADLRFALSGSPPNALNVLNSGDAVAPGDPMNPCFGLNSGSQSVVFDGLRCAITNTRRHGGRAADPNGEIGVTTLPWGGEGNPVIGIAQTAGFVSGQTRFFQSINRDAPLLGCMTALNTSQAVLVTFTP